MRNLGYGEQGTAGLYEIIVGLYKEIGAECVCIISNGKVTRMVVFELESGSMPAFGPIWDWDSQISVCYWY